MSEALSAMGTNDPARAPSEGTVVPCPLKQGARIGVGRCVEWQRDNGCHCEHALVSLRRVEKLLAENPPRDGCAPDVLSEHAERLDEVRQLIVRAEQIEKQRPAPPAEEEPVAKRSYEEGRTCSGEGCTNPVIDGSKTGKCTPCMQGLRPGSAAHAAKSAKKGATTNGNGHAEPKAPKVRKPPKANIEPKPPAGAPVVEDDVVAYLQRQRDNYQAQIARIDRAIAALAE